MSLILNNCLSSSCSLWGWKNPTMIFRSMRSSNTNCVSYGNGNRKSKGMVKAFFFNPSEEPILQQALKEPVAFMGGMFAGLLRLDLNDDPLKEWVSRTVEAAGITEEIGDEGSKDEEDAPQQIEIE
ncbi:hypothetical protein SLE2022_294490 [Rubroshorea leprosula]